MKLLLEKYATYNTWANQKMIQRLESLEEPFWHQLIPSSFNSIYKTVLHVWDSESIWAQRLLHSPKVVRPSEFREPAPTTLCEQWLLQSRQLEEIVKNQFANDESLASMLSYTNLKGDKFQQPFSEILLHVFNHSTYHRGQLITLLHSVGVHDVPNTDFIAFCRLKKEE